jgi:propanol-preferring alcohol dehydrogenase
MRAMVLRDPNAPLHATSLQFADIATPSVGPADVLVRVSVCGVCRTDLDLVEGRLIAPRYPVIPGHQVVGRIMGIGATVNARRIGERVGVAWIHSACGACAFCLGGRENLCPRFEATGCDADGGFAEYLVVPAGFVYPIPDALSDVHAAPLLCAGAIGWRSLRLTQLHDGDVLGLSGFGASAHLVLQLARRRFPNSPVFVFARDGSDRDFARELGAAWAGDIGEEPPRRLNAIIDTTPAWRPVVEALPHLLPGGCLVINAIRKIDTDREALLHLDYARHLWMEREIRSVANVTREDVGETLALAAATGLRPTVEEVPMERVNEVLATMRGAGGTRGATVLRVGADDRTPAAAGLTAATPPGAAPW